MKQILMVTGGLIKLFSLGLIIALIIPVLFVAWKGSQPMQDSRAPEGMTYFEFMADRLEAAKVVQPSRCGWGMLLSLAVLGPVYSVVYTEAGLHPDGWLAQGIQPDPDIPRDIAGTPWYRVADVWWETVERLSWTMLGEPAKQGCRFRPVQEP